MQIIGSVIQHCVIQLIEYHDKDGMASMLEMILITIFTLSIGKQVLNLFLEEVMLKTEQQFIMIQEDMEERAENLTVIDFEINNLSIFSILTSNSSTARKIKDTTI